MLCRRLRRVSTKCEVSCRFMAYSEHIPKKFKVQHEEKIDRTTSEYEVNKRYHSSLLDKLQKLNAIALDGGGESKREHLKKKRKLPVMERLRFFVDDVDEMLEFGLLAGLNMPYGNVPRAGVVAGIAKVSGVQCMVVANDSTVKGGTIFPIGLKKNLRAFEIMRENRLPLVSITDSGGAFLPMQDEVFIEGGKIFQSEAVHNSMALSQLSIVVGTCVAGGAYIPTMCQEALIVNRVGHIFLGGPALVYAAVKEVISEEDLGGGVLHASVSGCVDHFTTSEQEAYQVGRDIVSTFNVSPYNVPQSCDEPIYDIEELYGLLSVDNQHQLDMFKVISRLVDGSRFHQFKAEYGKDLITGFSHLQGHLLGVVGNNGPMTEKAAVKGAHFVQLCDQRNIPLLFLHNTAPERELYQRYQGDWTSLAMCVKEQAKLIQAVACCQVPKLSLVIGNSFGSTNFAMCGRSFNPRFMFAWPNAQICISSQQDIEDQLASSNDQSSQTTQEHLVGQSSAFVAGSRMWVDGVITPQDTRKVLGKCLAVIKQGELFVANDVKRGVVRM